MFAWLPCLPHKFSEEIVVDPTILSHRTKTCTAHAPVLLHILTACYRPCSIKAMKSEHSALCDSPFQANTVCNMNDALFFFEAHQSPCEQDYANGCCHSTDSSDFKRSQMCLIGSIACSVAVQQVESELAGLLLTLGAHAQRGLQYLVCVSVCVCVCYSTSHFSRDYSCHKRY